MKKYQVLDTATDRVVFESNECLEADLERQQLEYNHQFLNAYKDFEEFQRHILYENGALSAENKETTIKARFIIKEQN